MWNSRVSSWFLVLVLLLVAWWLPWWIFLLAHFTAILLITNFYSALLPALIFDLSYLLPAPHAWWLPLPVTTLSVICLWLASGLQSRLRL